MENWGRFGFYLLRTFSLLYLSLSFVNPKTDRSTERHVKLLRTCCSHVAWIRKNKWTLTCWTLSGIRAQKASDVNFTGILRNILPWQQVVDIEFYDTNKTKLAYCHKSNCIKVQIDASDAIPTFWNRLRVKHGSLLLTRIEKSDDEREIKVKVHLNDYSVRLYTHKILVVNGSRGNY